MIRSIIASLLFAISLSAQVDTLWTKVYSGDIIANGQDIIATNSGGYAITGRISDVEYENYIYLLRTDSNGDSLWSKKYQQSGASEGSSIIQSSDGGFLIAGKSNNSSNQSLATIIKTDSLGNEAWVRTYGMAGSSMNDVIQSSNGNYFAVGQNLSKAWIVKFNDVGDTLWTNSIINDNTQSFSSVEKWDDNNFIIGGTSYDGGRNGLIAKIDLNGNFAWAKTYGHSSEWEQIYSICTDASGQIVAAGYTTANTAGGSDLWILSVTDTGDSLWSNSFGGPYSDYGYSIRHTSDDSYVVAGSFQPSNANNGDVFVVKTNSLGDEAWSLVFGGDDTDRAWSITQNTDETFIMVGTTESYGTYGSIWINQLTPESYYGPVWHVSTSGSDSNDGSAILPFASIQHAIDATRDGDTVLVQPGTFDENLNFNGKNIVVGSLFLTTQDTSYISQTIIDGNQNGSVVVIGSGESASSMLSGFVIQNGLNGDGGAIQVVNSHPTLDHLVITNCTANNSAGGIYLYNSESVVSNSTIFNTTGAHSGGILGWGGSPTLINLLIYNNQGGVAGGIKADACNMTIKHSTIVKNMNSGIWAGNTTTINIENSIFYKNGASPSDQIVNGGSTRNVSYSLVEGGYAGEGNINLDPIFQDFSLDNFKLQNYSPTIGSGSNDNTTGKDIEGNPRPNPSGSNPDMGAYENALATPIHNSFIHVSTSGEDNGSVGVESAPFATIQAAIGYSESGDTVLVQPGTYVENINFNGKNIVVGSLFLTTLDTSYITQTVIDGNQNGSVVTIDDGETSQAVLSGLTVTNGSGLPHTDVGTLQGSGLFIEGASPIITHCRVVNNTGQSGIGAYVHWGSSQFIDVVFSGNIEVGNADNGQDECVIFNGWTGASYRNCTIENNQALGIYSYGSTSSYDYMTFRYNVNGACLIDGSDITNSIFSDNYGYGLNLNNGGVNYCEIANNQGMGIQTNNDLYIDNCTITGNQNYGIYSYRTGVRITESIIFSNTNGPLLVDGDSVITFSYTLADTLFPGVGNIYGDPKFVSQVQNQFQLLASSLCINSGHPDSTDSDGSRADMGAFPYLNSYSEPNWYVAVDGDDVGGTGSTDNPFASIQAGINFAENGDSVLVSAGTYFENIDLRKNSITVIGVEGASETIIDGGQNSCVVYINHQSWNGNIEEYGSTTLGGFTITNGIGLNNEWGGRSGGGIYCYHANPTFAGLIIESNTVQPIPSNQGGGIYFSRSSALIENSIIRNNVAYQGGGLFFSNGSAQILKNVLIENNIVTANGGAAFFSATYNGSNAEPLFINTTIANNTSSGSGGGLYFVNGGFATLINSILWGNRPTQAEINSWPTPSELTVFYTDVENGSDGILIDENSTLNWLEGNIDVEPVFVDTSANDYSLFASSFCINNGHPDSTDSDGSRVDMGAFPYLNEYSGPDWHVAVDGDNLSGTGELSNPFASIQAGINFSNHTDSIKVNAGTYYEHIDLREKSVNLLGLGGSVFTIIDGSSTGRPITMHNQVETSQSISGFTLQNGSEYTGAGIYAIRSNAILNDLKLHSNTSSYQGGGLYSEYSDITTSNVIVGNNSANNGGAGFYLYETSLLGENLVAYNNNSTENGGFIHLHASSAGLNHTTIMDNTAPNGPAIYSRLNSTLEMFNSILWNHSDDPFFQDADSTITISYSDVEGGFEGLGNFALNPRFVDQASRIYNLTDNSPCLGAGYDTTYISSMDIEGNMRPNPTGSNPDMGAYESPLAEPVIIVEIQNLDIGGEEELLHLLTHTPDVSFTFYNSLEEPLSHYQMQVSTLSDFSAIDMWDTYTVIGSDTIVTYTGNALLDGEEYFLRVKGTSGDFWSDWVILSFRMNSVPQPPMLVSPIENSVVGDEGLFTLQNSMDNESDPLSYQFSLYEDMAMTTIVESSGLIPEDIDVTTWTSTSELSDNNQYWWTSRVFDSFEYSAVSNPASFLVNTENSPPDPFELIFPLVDMELSILTPSFSWHSALDVDPEDVVSYSLHLDTPEPGVLVFELGSDTLFLPPEPLLDNTEYFWRVVASDLLGFETESIGGYTSFVINVSNDNPSIVDLITPDSVLVLSLTPQMVWSPAFDVDPGDMVSYEMHWWGDGIEYDSVLTDTNAVVLPRELEDNTQYFWDVITMDSHDGISHSEPATFWTDLIPEAPGAFALLSPENDAAGQSNMPSFQWEIAEDPDPMDYATYTLQIAADSSFSEVVFETNTNVDVGLELTEALPTDTEYWWRVFAIDTDSLATESEVFKFTVGYVSIAEEIALPTEYMLDQNYPNPFNPSTTIRYGLPEEANVSLVIYDVRGQVVQTLESGHQSAGWYDVVWNGQTADRKTISTGIYFARLVAGDYSQVVKMLYLK